MAVTNQARRGSREIRRDRWYRLEKRVDCPSDETLAAWCDRRLAGSEKLRVDLHLINCDYCREIVIAVCQDLEAQQVRRKSGENN